MSRRFIFAIVGIAILVVILILVSPFFSSGSHVSQALSSTEVRSFQGQELSSINDLQENAINGVQYVNITSYRLTVTGLTNRTMVYSYDQVLSTFPSYYKVVTLHCVEGWDVTILWKGVLVRDILNNAGIDPSANTVVFTAEDGYTTSFPLSYFTQNDIIIAYSMNNVTLPAERGYPLRLVAEDKWGYKWIKWIDKIELTNDPSYKGYWEERGYSNSGDLNASYYG